MANKKIRLHPFINGVQDKNTNLYPETTIDAVQGLQDALDNKQGELTPAEQSAVDSGITAEKVTQYDGYSTSKQDTIDEEHKLDASLVDGLEDTINEIENKVNNVEPLNNKLYKNLIEEVHSGGVLPEGTIQTLKFDLNPDDIRDIIGYPSYGDNKTYLLFKNNETGDYGIYNCVYTYRVNESLLFKINGIYYQFGLTDNLIFYGTWWKSKDANNWTELTSQNDLPEIKLFDTYSYPISLTESKEFEPDIFARSLGYELLEEEPEDWDHLYNLYYYYDSDNDVYVQINSNSVPAFEQNMYYQQNYISLETEPQDWSDYWNYYSYETIWNIMEKLLYMYVIVPQSLEEKFNEIEEKIDSHSDSGYLKNKIYGPSLKLVDGAEYELKEDCSEFFDKFTSGGPIYQEPINDNGGGDISFEPGLMSTNASPKSRVNANNSLDYITEITYFTDGTPIKPDPTPIYVGKGDISGDIPYPGPVGRSSINIVTSFYNYYHYYANSDSWQDDNGNEVNIADLPRLIFNSSATYNEEMLKNILAGKDITLEEKFNEGLKDWPYENKQITSEGMLDVPEWSMFDGLSDYDTIYESEDLIINYSVEDNVLGLTFRDIVKNASYIIVAEDVSGYMTIKANTWYIQDRFGLVETTNPKFTLDPNYMIPMYSSLFDAIYGTTIINIPVSVADHNADIANWIYKDQKETYELLEVPNWEGMGTTLELWAEIYSYKKSGYEYSDIVYVGENSGHGSVCFQVASENSTAEYEIYNEDWTDSEAEGFEVKADTYYKVSWDYTVRPSVKHYEEEIPQMIVNKDGIESENLFACVYKYIPAIKQTVDEKFNEPLKDKTYDTIPENYKLLTPDWENIDVSESYYSIYIANYSTENYEEEYCDELCESVADVVEDYSSQEIYEIAAYKVIGYDPIEDRVLKEEYYNLNKDCVVGYGSSQQLTKGIWYKGTYDDNLGYYVFEEVDNIEMLFHENNIVEEYKNLFNQLVQYIPEQKITLDEKLNEIEPPYTITDYTEDNGALTSITVKSKETGEPTVLTVGGGKTLYQHNIVIARKNDNYSRVSIMIPNDDPTEFTYSLLLNWLYTKGFIYKDQNAGRKNNPYLASGGWTYDGSSYYAVSGVMYNDYTNEIAIRGCGSSGLTGSNASSTNATYEDTVIPL